MEYTPFFSYDLKKSFSFHHVLFLYNRTEHLHLQHSNHCRVYEIRDRKVQPVKARIVFSIDGRKATSPNRAPFGFFEIYKETTTDELAKFVAFIEADLKHFGVRQVLLKGYPELYSPSLQVIEGALLQLNYTVTREVSSMIRVDEKSFERKIAISERQKLKKAAKVFTFEKLKLNSLAEVYAFIDACRKERNQTLSMHLSDLKKTIATFPNNFFLFRVHQANETAAAAIVVKVNSEILYTFYYAHARKYDKVSPIVMLLTCIYEWAQTKKVNWIDLGTSMVNGKINRSLLHFKKSIGGQSNRKLNFEKYLE